MDLVNNYLVQFIYFCYKLHFLFPLNKRIWFDFNSVYWNSYQYPIISGASKLQSTGYYSIFSKYKLPKLHSNNIQIEFGNIFKNSSERKYVMLCWSFSVRDNNVVLWFWKIVLEIKANFFVTKKRKKEKKNNNNNRGEE